MICRTGTVLFSILVLCFLFDAFAESNDLQQSASSAALPSKSPPKPPIAPPPPTPKRPVVDVIQGVKITDDYRWLEGNTPEVRAWSQAQTARASAYLDALPVHSRITQWLKQLFALRTPSYDELRAAGDELFAIKSQPGKQQELLVTLKSADDLASERVVLDPNVLDPGGKTAIQFYVPSLDGRLVAVCLAQGGSESGTVHVYETQTGKALPDMVPRVNFPTAGGSLAWNTDGSGFYYTRYPHEGERPPTDINFYQQVYFHKLGNAVAQDSYAIGKEFPRIAETTLMNSPDGRYVLALVANGDGGDYEHFLRDPSGKWIQLTSFSDQVSAAGFGEDGALYLLSRKDAPRGKLMRMSLSTPDLKDATTVVPESDAVIQGFRFSLAGQYPSFAATRDRIFVVYLVGGPTEIRIFDLAGHPAGSIKTLPVSTVDELLSWHDHLLFRNTSFTEPPAWYTFNVPQTATAVTALRSQTPVSFADVEVSREFATSRDGTKVPVNILRKKTTILDGQNPTILMGYGGFDISISPGFHPNLRPWLDAGGVVAIANLRGGGEFGEQWHRAGMLNNKQHVFDDFIACAEHLIQARYTNPRKLGIEGGSNGGLLMGAVLTQRPELFRAVVGIAGIYDMLRMETTQNGQFNVTEFGSVKNPEQFRAIYAYSPYEHVRAGTKYLAVLLTVGENDLRADPWHSRKFAARLQAASTSGLPIFLISFAGAGHGGIGAAEDQRIAMEAYAQTFFFDQLGASFASTPLGK